MRLTRILVVDDSELLHRMYDLVLRRYRDAGAEILHARDGSAAVTMARSDGGVDLMLLDVNMPVLNGMQTLSALNALRLLPDVKVIMISTEGGKREMQRAIELGAVGFLTKPFNPADMHAMIAAHFMTDDRVLAAVGSPSYR